MERSSTQMQRQIEQIYNNLQTVVIPQSNQVFSTLTKFYKIQIQEYQYLLQQTGTTTQIFRNKLETCESNLNQIVAKRNKDTQFTSKGQGYLHGKDQEIKSKVKNIDAVLGGIKQTVSKIKPDRLAKLPVKKQKPLQELFKTLYQVLYNGNAQKFDWLFFKEKALEHQSGQDFIFRLVNINFKDLSAENSNRLLIIKTDPQWENICVHTPYSHDILDIADWIEYVCVGHKFSEQKKDCQRQYQKIKKDIHKKAKNASPMSQQFWREAGQEIQAYQNNLLQIESQIKAIMIGMNRSIEDINESINKKNSKIQQINAL